MRKFTLLLVLGIAAFSAWVYWSYRSIPGEIAKISARLPSEEELNRMSPDELNGIKLNLTMGCGRTAELQANPIARMLRGDEIKALGERCQLIKARLASVEGP